MEDVKFVINFDYPNNSEDYVHRIGRTGRSNNTGTAYTLFTYQNASKAGDLINVLKEANQVSLTDNAFESLSNTLGLSNNRLCFQVVNPRLFDLIKSSSNNNSRSRYRNNNSNGRNNQGYDRPRFSNGNSNNNLGNGGNRFGGRDRSPNSRFDKVSRFSSANDQNSTNGSNRYANGGSRFSNNDNADSNGGSRYANGRPSRFSDANGSNQKSSSSTSNDFYSSGAKFDRPPPPISSVVAPSSTYQSNGYGGKSNGYDKINSTTTNGVGSNHQQQFTAGIPFGYPSTAYPVK